MLPETLVDGLDYPSQHDGYSGPSQPGEAGLGAEQQPGCPAHTQPRASTAHQKCFLSLHKLLQKKSQAKHRVLKREFLISFFNDQSPKI